MSRCGKLEEICIDMKEVSLRRLVDRLRSIEATLDFLDKLQIRRSVQRYTIDWKIHYKETDRNHFLDKIFFKDYKHHPLLEKITFIIDNSDALQVIVKIFNSESTIIVCYKRDKNEFETF